MTHPKKSLPLNYSPLKQKVLFTAFCLLGALMMFLSALVEHSMTGRTAVMATHQDLQFEILRSDLIQAISAAATKVLAGLCLVAAAIIFASGVKPPETEVAREKGTTTEKTGE